MTLSSTESAEYHVSPSGNDNSDGSAQAPFRTISAAARVARPGDVITVHAGTFRERVNPPRGGESDDRRIVYRAAAGERVEIKGSEIVTGWENEEDDVWKVDLPNGFFGGYNPYADLVRGDWFDPKGRDHHTGQVYLNGVPLVEAADFESLMSDKSEPSWYAKVSEETTTLWARFESVDPNRCTVEINVRPTVFYPERPGIDFITVSGFIMRHAATQWAPPTTEQVGLIGTHWSKGWIIENNTVSDSRCAGITLGKYGNSVDDVGATADRYNQTVRDALADGWHKGSIGSHIVRNNTIYNCEQAGIAGSLGAAFSEVSGNHIYQIHVARKFGGAEMAGIKFHGAIDSVIKGNRIHHTCLGIWLDWMAQGTRVSGNLLYENDRDLFLEVNHGPFVVDNNILLSKGALLNMSEGGAYAHNLVAGDVVPRPELSRETPFHREHSTEVAGLSLIRGGDDRFYNNLFVGGNGLREYDEELGEPQRFPVRMAGNVFFGDAAPSKYEQRPILGQPVPGIELVEGQEEEGEDGVLLRLDMEEIGNDGEPNPLVTSELLGKAQVPNLPFTSPDGAPLCIDSDYFGGERSTTNPVPGPFAHLEGGKRTLRLWPM